jgi:hypothetical protein
MYRNNNRVLNKRILLKGGKEMIEKDGMVVMTSKEYHELKYKDYTIEELESRNNRLQKEIVKLLTRVEIDADNTLFPKDFAEIYNMVLDNFLEDDNKREELLYNEAVLIWNGIKVNVGDGAMFANFIVPALEDLATEMEA